MRPLVALGLALAATPALAQHQHHQAAPAPAPAPAPETPPAPSPETVDHSTMDHSTMDHSTMDHGEHALPADAGPPPDAGSGPPTAADSIWGAEAMRESREALAREHGAMKVFWLQGDRLELGTGKGRDTYLWDVQGYYGGDIDKFWFKSEGEGAFGERIEDAEVQALWSHAITPWFDLQAGLRQDLAGPSRTHAVAGIQGLAPYFFELDAAAFLSTKGELTGRFEAELDQRVTQRLILQPRAELSLSAQDIPELGIGAGLDRFSLGLRVRYEITREFAPYVGVEQQWALGKSGDFARAEGEDRSSTRLLLGLRFWL